MMRAAALLAMPALAGAHGAMVHPRSRNAVDGNGAPWTAGVPWPVPFAGHTAQWCPISHATDPKKLSGSNGQACYW